MKYVDWVEHVLMGLRDAKAAQASPSINLSNEALADHLGVADKERGVEAVGDALRDLKRLSAVEAPNYHNVLLTSEGKRLAKQSMRVLWPKADDTWLDDTQIEYLPALIDMSEWRAETHASLNEVDENDLVTRLEWATRDDVNVDLRELRSDLRDRGLIDGRFTLGNSTIYPTYVAIVKLTEMHTLADTELVRSLLRRWEGVNVDFKRQMSIKTKDDKAEFVKDVLSLANPQVVGRPLLGHWVRQQDPQVRSVGQSEGRAGPHGEPAQRIHGIRALGTARRRPIPTRRVDRSCGYGRID